MKNNGGSKLKKAQKKKLRKIFLRVVITTLIVCSGVMAAGVTLYNKYILSSSEGDKEWSLTNKPLDKINKNLAVFGVDEDGYRTDVIFVVNFNSETNKVKVVAVPRDTKVDWSEAQRDKLMLYTGKSVYTTKINEMTSYSGIENIRQFTIPELESMLDVNIDNYVIVTTDAFRQLIDAIGGVTVDVPALGNGQGLNYDDDYQNLHIHLEPGVQTLDGAQAEGMVRFRKDNYGNSYAEGDVGRIKTQQIFLDAFAKKILSPTTFAKLPQISEVILDSVTTDVKLGEITGYLKYMKNFNSENISFYIVPGEAEYTSGKWYYVVNEGELPTFRNEVFHDIVPEEVPEEEVVEDKTVSIEILNSTGRSGLAGNEKAVLENAGYSVASVGNYTLDILNQSIIYTKDIEKARQFKKYFTNAKVVEDQGIAYDITIVLGNDVQ